MTWLWLANLWAYSWQVAIVTALAALLVRLARLRSPGAVLGYWQAVLAASLLLPLLEPWRPVPAGVPSELSIDFASGIPFAGHGPAASPVWLAVALIATGMAIRLIWLAMGLWQLRRHIPLARPLDPQPAWLADLMRTLGVRPDLRVCWDLTGPVTFGLRRPSVLLPARWLELDRDRQAAIVCHELLHVRRRDWAFHIVEELIRAALWFHPAIWWLLAEVRLAREQVVDRAVVRLTGARRPYVEALLAFANTGGELHISGAPAFSRGHQLTRRVSLILEEVTMSKFRLIASLTGLTVCLAIAGAYAAWSVPLQRGRSSGDSEIAGGISGGVVPGVPRGVAGGVPGGVAGGIAGGIPGGIAQNVAAEPQDLPIHRVSEKGVIAPRVLHKTDPAYTETAKDSKIEGTVVVELEVHPDGRAHNTRIERSLDPGLDRNALDAISNWRFQPATKDGKLIAVSATIEMNFRLK